MGVPRDATRGAATATTLRSSSERMQGISSMIARRRLLAASLFAPGVAWAQASPPAAAETWPSRPVRILLAYPPGGSTDVLARTLAERLAIAIPGPGFVVENRAGGAAVVGTQAAA